MHPAVCPCVLLYIKVVICQINHAHTGCTGAKSCVPTQITFFFFKFFVFSLFFSLSVNFSVVLTYKICDSNIHKTALADISSVLKKLELSLHISYYFLPFESRSLQLEPTKFPMFWQNFRNLFGFPDREFCGHFPCFPCAMRMFSLCNVHVLYM